MVFSSVPVYLDPPNWPQQQPNYQQVVGVGGSSSTTNNEKPQLPPPPAAVPPPSGNGSTCGSVKPGSMAERARLAKIIPQPENALNCPRCESTNTKFCYFNNYSLSQPRHFCKTCRRYWTRGGALRNVPVGGGCRRNKRSSKGSRTSTTTSRSKSPSTPGGASTSISCSNNNNNNNNSCAADNILGNLGPQFPLFPSFHHHLGNFDMGLNFGGILPPVAAAATGSGATAGIEFQIGTTNSNTTSSRNNPTARFTDHHHQLRMHQGSPQFSFLSGLVETPSGISYQFESEGGGGEQPNYYDHQQQQQQLIGSKSPLLLGNDQLSSVKLEENRVLNLSRNFLGISGGNDQYWSGNSNAWTDLSGFTSSSTSHLL